MTPGSGATAARPDRGPCNECGQVHERCTGHKSDGSPCGRWPTHGVNVCAKHGAQLPRVKAIAARNVVDERIRRSFAGIGASPVQDPYTELQRLAGQVVGWKDSLAAIVESMSGDAKCPECDATVPGAGEWRYEASGAGTEQLRSELSLFERALDRCGATLGMIAKLDIDKRLAAISEMQAQAVLRAVDAAVTAMESGRGPIEARQAAARELRAAA